MQLLKEIYHQSNLNLEGETIYREAVRGIIKQNDKFLLIYSLVNGDYKFPGGGVEKEESYQEALLREVREECGALVTDILGEFGRVIEYKKPLEDEYDVFKMTSYYYLCEVEEDYCAVELDKYEEELGFKAVWVDIDEAIKTNNYIINSNKHKTPRWTCRDNFVMRKIKKSQYINLINNDDFEGRI